MSSYSATFGAGPVTTTTAMMAGLTLQDDVKPPPPRHSVLDDPQLRAHILSFVGETTTPPPPPQVSPKGFEDVPLRRASPQPPPPPMPGTTMTFSEYARDHMQFYDATASSAAAAPRWSCEEPTCLANATVLQAKRIRNDLDATIEALDLLRWQIDRAVYNGTYRLNRTLPLFVRDLRTTREHARSLLAAGDPSVSVSH